MTERRLGVDGRVLDDRYHGIGRVSYELLTRLADRPGWQVVLFLPDELDCRRLDLPALLGRNSIEVHRFDHSMTSLRQFAAWPRALRSARVDTALFPYHLGAALTGGRTRIAVVHDCILEESAEFAPSRRTRQLYMLLTRLVVRRDRVVTPSRASADAVRRFYPRRAAEPEVVTWGVGSGFGPAATASRAGGNRIAGRYLLHVGARRPHKNVPHLVRVLAGLPSELHLVLVGSPDPRWPDDSMTLAAELGVADRVHELTNLGDDDLAELYRNAEAFVYPSVVEGFGLPLLEAMSAGAPVIASDIAVFREVAADAALLVRPDDVAGWIAAVQRLSDPTTRGTLVAKGLRRSEAATWEHSVEQLLGVLERAAR